MYGRMSSAVVVLCLMAGGFLMMTGLSADALAGEKAADVLSLPPIPKLEKPPVPVPPPGGQAKPVPAKGDWVVSERLAYADMEIAIPGSLTVKNGGTLILSKVVLKMNPQKDGGCSIEVQKGGALFVIGGSTISSASKAAFNFRVSPGAKAVMVDSELRGTTGFIIEADDVYVKGNIITANRQGLVLRGASRAWIEANRIEDNQGVGVLIEKSSNRNVVLANSIRKNKVMGIETAGNENLIYENVCEENANQAIRVDGSRNVIYKNTCARNNPERTWHGGGIGIGGMDTNVTHNVIVDNGGCAIWTHGRQYITYNEIRGSTAAGINAEYGPDGMVIAYNKISGANCAIRTKFGYRCKIVGNVITDLSSEPYYTLQDDLRSVPSGIVIQNPEYPSCWNLVEGNKIVGNNKDGWGIAVTGAAIDNVIRNNDVSECGRGIVAIETQAWRGWETPRLDWPTFRRRNGNLPYARAPVAPYPWGRRKVEPGYPPDPKLLWSFKTKMGIRSTPVVSQSLHMYVVDDDGVVHALDENSGRLLWKYDTGGKLPEKLAGVGEVILHPSAAVDHSSGNVYVSKGKGVCALDEQSGKLKWEHATDGYVIASPEIDHQGRVYVADTAGYLYALGSDGNPVWKKKVSESPIVATPCFTFTPVRENLRADTGKRKYEKLIVKDSRGYVSALNLDDGKLLWKRETETGSAWSSPVYPIESVTFFLPLGSSSGTAIELCSQMIAKYSLRLICAAGKRAYGLNAADGGIDWKADLGSEAVATPTLDRMGKFVYLPCLDGKVRTIGLDGKVATVLDMGEEVISSAAASASNVCFAGKKGKVYRHGLGLKDWEEKLGAPVVSSVILFNTSKFAVCTTLGEVRVYYTPRKLILEGNYVHHNEAGIFAYDAVFSLSKCRIEDNRAAGIHGEYGLFSDPNTAEGWITDCTFKGNKLDFNLERHCNLILKNTAYDKAKANLGDGSTLQERR